MRGIFLNIIHQIQSNCSIKWPNDGYYIKEKQRIIVAPSIALSYRTPSKWWEEWSLKTAACAGEGKRDVGTTDVDRERPGAISMNQLMVKMKLNC